MTSDKLSDAVDEFTNDAHPAQKIRCLAAKNNLVARKSRKDGRWRFTDFNNTLRSPEQGLDDETPEPDQLVS